MEDIAAKFGARAHILVVDDHSLTRTMVRSILKGVGFEHVNQAESGSAAMVEIRSAHYDLVICDWNMPDGNGLEVLQALRQTESTKTLPFLMLTAEAYRENVKAAIEAGVTEYIVKPFSADTLLQKVELILKRRFKA